MTSKYDGSRGAATHLLKHYFRLVAERAGVQWDGDNDVEIEAIVDGIITAAVHQVAEDSARAAQARRELEALDLEDFAQQPVDATQEDGANMAPAYECYQCGASLVYDERDGSISCPVHGSDFLPPAMRRALDGDLQCGMCLSHITSTYAVAYEDGYFCPACASKALRRDSIGMHRLRETIASLRARLADAGLSAQDATQEAQPVPVSAIAYLMADIAPADKYDTAKQQEARATVTAWLESLEAEEG